MAKSAHIESLDVLRQFRAAMVKFGEAVNSALGDAESEMQRVQMWVENEQSSHWQHQLRKRQDALVKAKEALRQKQIFKDVTGARQSYVDEEKAVAMALRRVQEAEQKIINVKRWTRQLEKETNLYKGSVQRLMTTITADLPKANAKLDRMFSQLQEYVAIAPTEAASTIEGSQDDARMARPEAGPPQPGELYRALRQQTPKPEFREKLPSLTLAIEKWDSPELNNADLDKLMQLPLARELVDPDSVLTVAGGVADARRIYLQRVVGVFPGDSGWHIGPADGTAAMACHTARVQELISTRPSLAQLLQLPLGTLLVIDSAGIAAVLDAQDQDLWQSARGTISTTQSSLRLGSASETVLASTQLSVKDGPQS